MGKDPAFWRPSGGISSCLLSWHHGDTGQPTALGVRAIFRDPQILIALRCLESDRGGINTAAMPIPKHTGMFMSLQLDWSRQCIGKPGQARPARPCALMNAYSQQLSTPYVDAKVPAFFNTAMAAQAQDLPVSQPSHAACITSSTAHIQSCCPAADWVGAKGIL
jgi:hypothetical protein